MSEPTAESDSQGERKTPGATTQGRRAVAPKGVAIAALGVVILAAVVGATALGTENSSEEAGG